MLHSAGSQVLNGWNAFSAATTGGSVPLSDCDFFSVNLTGTWVGTMKWMGSLDNVNWFDIALQNANGAVTPAVSLTSTGTDKNGNYFASAGSGLLYVRVVTSAWTSGTAYVYTTKHRGTYVSGQDFWDTAMPFTRDAVFAIDASRSSVGETVVVNAGSGGTVLNATLGSTGGADSNDPLLLPWTGTNYLYTTGVAGNNASAPLIAAYDITGAIEMVGRCSGLPTSDGYLFLKGSSYATRAYSAVLRPTGALAFWSRDSALAVKDLNSSAVLPYGATTRFWWKITADPVSGNVNFYHAADASTEPSVWTPLGTTQNAVFAGSAFTTNTDTLLVSNVLESSVYRAIVRNGIGGTTAFDANFTTGITSGAQTTFTESSSNAATVTINRGTTGRKAVAVTRPVWLLGTDDYMEVANNALVNFDGSQDFTVLVIARTWNTPASYTYYMTKQTPLSPTGNKGWDIRNNVWPNVGGAMGDGSAVGNFNQFPSAGTTASPSSLMTLGMTRSGTATNAFFNNTFGATNTNSYDTTNTTLLRIGSGSLDTELLAVAVFRRALTATEIATINTYYGTA